MRKIVSLVMAILLFPLAANAERYEEGKHYEIVTQEVSSKPEVREYFSFYCPHCYSYEPLMKDLKKSLPDGVSFEKNHVDFMRGASSKVQTMLTKAMILGDQLERGDELNNEIFKYIHRQRAVFTSEKDIRNLFVLNGVDGEKFDKLMKSFSLNSKVKQLKKHQDKLARSGKLSSVPTVVVNGKYKVLTKNLDKSDQQGDYIKLVNYLLTLK